MGSAFLLGNRVTAASAVIVYLSALLPNGDASAAPLTILENGASRYRIVCQATASPSEKTAAVELQACFKECMGVELAGGVRSRYSAHAETPWK